MNDLPPGYGTAECENCGGEYTYRTTHTGEIHCPHCKSRVKVQLGEVIQ